jgi:hypothetical protein
MRRPVSRRSSLGRPFGNSPIKLTVEARATGSRPKARSHDIFLTDQHEPIQDGANEDALAESMMSAGRVTEHF